MWMVTFLDESTGNRNVRVFSDSEFEVAKGYSMHLMDMTGIAHVQLCAVHECLVSVDVPTDNNKKLIAKSGEYEFNTFIEE